MPRKTSKSVSESTWIPTAIASGACAAVNGVFAKLTTTTLTSTWAAYLSALLNEIAVPVTPRVTEVLIRSAFFALNMAFNGVMWGLFTRALTLADSTVQVSIINTSANFVITALLGWVVFAERLPPLWWLGASMLVVGSVIIGRREEGAVKEKGKPTKVTDDSSAAKETQISTPAKGTRSATSSVSKSTRSSTRKRQT